MAEAFVVFLNHSHIHQNTELGKESRKESGRNLPRCVRIHDESGAANGSRKYKQQSK